MLKALRKKLRKGFVVKNADDSRSRRLVVVIECILNQNARDLGAANFPAVCQPILSLCNEYDVGIIQIPCPEIRFLGFERMRQEGQSIRDALDTCAGRDCCRKISVEIVNRIESYLDQGYQLLSILGGNPRSPGCAVHSENGTLLPSSGVLMKELQNELRQRGVEIPFRGIRDYNSKMFAQDIEWLRELFSNRLNLVHP
ncbi:MAG: hypothetical protein JXA04_06555 [Gammaproteobacteria bacterium]|nr:hypothetical protein [Gammaproteobacteria bacterium]